MKKVNSLLSLACLVVVVFLSSCNKDKDGVTPTSKTTHEQNVAKANATLDIIAEVQSLNNMGLLFTMPEGETSGTPNGRVAATKENSCGQISSVTDEATGNTQFIIDFGTGTTCDSIIRKGKIIYTLSASSETEMNMTLKFEGYEADGKKLEGNYSIAITMTSSESEMLLKYVYTFNNAVLTNKDGSKLSWNSNYQLDLKISMDTTSNQTNFTMQMTGGLSGKDAQGKTFSADITSPIIWDPNCSYVITKGKYLLKAEGYSDAVYDFGNGACDTNATLTVDGKIDIVDIND